MKKKIYTPPHLEELSVDDIQLLAGSNNTGGAGGLKPGAGSNPNPDEEDEFEG